jgi:hypothetical protein
MANNLSFHEEQKEVLKNLEILQSSLVQCLEEGMKDNDAEYYNELLGFIDDAQLVKEWDELVELISRAKNLEIDIAAWLARNGRTTMSLTWPSHKPSD